MRGRLGPALELHLRDPVHAPDQMKLGGHFERDRYPCERPSRHMIWVLLGGLALLLPQPAIAVPACSATLSGGLDFGPYDVYSPAPLTATARLRLTCPKGLTPQITISAGNSGAFDWRELRSLGDALRYNVYQDAGMTIIWGDGTGGSSAYLSAAGNAQLTVYGRVPAAQDVTSGAYTDLLTVTVFL